MSAKERAAIKARAEAATYVGGDIQELAEDTLALLDALDDMERDRDRAKKYARNGWEQHDKQWLRAEDARAKLAALRTEIEEYDEDPYESYLLVKSFRKVLIDSPAVQS